MQRETLLHCYIALDYDTLPTSAAESSSNVTTYELPDGNILTVGTKRFRREEVLQPSLQPVESCTVFTFEHCHSQSYLILRVI